jgi:hypothetical protein
MSEPTFADRVAAWASRTPSIRAVVLIGSHVRETSDAVAGADAHSDWDFHIITSRPRMFADRVWTHALGAGDPLVYAMRDGVVGKVKRMTAIFRGAEADFVVLPAGQLRLVRLTAALGLHRHWNGIARVLADLAIVARPGYRFLYGAADWAPFYGRVVAEVADPRLEDDELLRLAELFSADYLWVRRKLDRGELLAAQRILHRSLAETNFRLLHEFKLRRGERSFPDVRRIERVATAVELAAVTVAAEPTACSIRAALEKSADTCRSLMASMLGNRWHWPEL